MKMEFDDIFPNSFTSTSPIMIDKNKEKINCFYLNTETKNKKLLAEIDIKKNTTIIYPINTIENSPYYLEPKYDINELIFEGYEVDISKTDSNEDGIYGLPKGFTKTVVRNKV